LRRTGHITLDIFSWERREKGDAKEKAKREENTHADMHTTHRLAIETSRTP
jgi:hypothetical protein